MLRFRNYWTYSAGLAIVWAIILLILAIWGGERMQIFLLVFGGYCIGWVSTTIARYIYPPPKRWEATATRSDLLNWPPIRHRASDTQRATRDTHVDFLELVVTEG